MQSSREKRNATSLWRFYQGPYGEWHWISVVDGVERRSNAGYMTLDDCMREARRRGLESHHATSIASASLFRLVDVLRPKKLE